MRLWLKVLCAGGAALVACAFLSASFSRALLVFSLIHLRHVLYVLLCAGLYAVIPSCVSAKGEAARGGAVFLLVVLLVVLAGTSPFGAGFFWLGKWGIGALALLTWAGIWVLFRKPRWALVFPSAGLTALGAGIAVLALNGRQLPLLAAEILSFVCLILWLMACRMAVPRLEQAPVAVLALQQARDEAIQQERQRYIQDMHDGLGANLVSLLAAVKNRKIADEELAEGLQGCLDEMRLVIDARGVGTEDLGSALANVRYRMESRMRAAGIATRWDILGLPDDFLMEQDKTLCVLRVLQESIANAIKYSRASELGIRASSGEDRFFELTVEDNGVGIDSAVRTTSQGNGLGLEGMRKRAETLGGSLDLGAGASGKGVRVTLRLPRD